VRQLLARDDVDINAIGFDGEWRPVYPGSLNTPLTAACKGSHPEIANILLAREGIDVNLHKPLSHALSAGMVGVVESLLARDDLDADIMDNFGHVLVRSVFQGHGIVKSLLDRYNIDPNVVRGDGVTALIKASSLGYVDIVKLLLNQEGIQVNQQDNLGLTALCYAAIRDDPEIAKALLDRDDINPNLPNNGFWERGHRSQSVVKLILEKGLPLRWNVSLSEYDVYY
jgi:ankyrin repeat protein